ncbi:hypothetical protein ACM66B_000088 [Microbotryomycetes sp. NB124-2]
MPKTTNIGTPGPANNKIGGVPEYGFEEWNSKTPEERAKHNPSGTIPFLFLDGKVFGQSIPMLRYFARQLGAYDGKTSEETYFVDRVNDVTGDWRTKFVDSHFAATPNGLQPVESNDKALTNYKEYLMPRAVRGLEKLLSTSVYSNNGPYVLGGDISYADLDLWQMWHDSREVGPVKELVANECPTLQKLLDAVESRPQLKAYWSSDRYYD